MIILGVFVITGKDENRSFLSLNVYTWSRLSSCDLWLSQFKYQITRKTPSALGVLSCLVSN